MDYFLTEEQKEIKGLARQIAEERVLPVRAELDEKEEFPRDIMNELGSSDMFRVFVPEEYEGLGGGCLELCLVVEELSRICSAVAVSYAVKSLGGRERGMVSHYQQHFTRLVAEQEWPVEKLLLESELVFVVEKATDPG